jgi:hypothetical protein
MGTFGVRIAHLGWKGKTDDLQAIAHVEGVSSGHSRWTDLAIVLVAVLRGGVSCLFAAMETNGMPGRAF